MSTFDTQYGVMRMVSSTGVTFGDVLTTLRHLSEFYKLNVLLQPEISSGGAEYQVWRLVYSQGPMSTNDGSQTTVNGVTVSLTLEVPLHARDLNSRLFRWALNSENELVRALTQAQLGL